MGRMSIRFDISSVQLEALVEVGLLDRALREDAAEVALAIYHSLDRPEQATNLRQFWGLIPS